MVTDRLARCSLRSLPPDWDIRTVASLGQVVTGTTPSTCRPEYYGGDTPFVSPGDLGEHRYIARTEATLTHRGAQQARLVPPGSVLVTCIGILGKLGQADNMLATNQQINSVVLSEQVDSSYAYWAMHLLKEQLEIEAGLQVVPIVNKSRFSGLLLPMPPLPQQRRISEILDTADDATRQTERLIAKLEAIRVGLLNDLLIRGLDEYGRLRDPQAHPEQFNNSPLGRIPTSWQSMPLSDICAVISRGNAPTYVEQSSVLAIGQRCVQESGFDASAARPQDERRLSDALFAVAGDVLLNSTGTGTIGRACVFDGLPQTYVVDGHVTLLRTHSQRADGRWLNALLQLEAVQQYLASYFYSGSTNQIELSRNRLEASCFAVPPLAEQRRIGNILDAAGEAVRQSRNELAKLRQIKLGLMDDLLTGKVRVTAA